jgi:predicted tellurium resistance membrane protein TerC
MNKWNRFKEGLKNLTPLQQLNAKAMGSLWGAIGLVIAVIGMVYSITLNFTLTQLGFIIFVVFLIYMQLVQYIGIKQQIEAVKKIEEELKRLDEELKELEVLKKL